VNVTFEEYLELWTYVLIGLGPNPSGHERVEWHRNRRRRRAEALARLLINWRPHGWPEHDWPRRDQARQALDRLIRLHPGAAHLSPTTLALFDRARDAVWRPSQCRL